MPKMLRSTGVLIVMALLLLVVGGSSLSGASWDHVDLETVIVTRSFGTPQLALGEVGESIVSLDDLPLLAIPGKPALPYQVVHIVVPPSDDALLLDVVAGPALRIGRDLRLTQAPCQFPIGEGDDVDTASRTASSPTELWPTTWAEIVSDQRLAGYRVVSIHLYPVRWDPVEGSLLYAPNMRVQVGVRAHTETQSDPQQPRSSAVSAAAAELAPWVENPKDLDRFTPMAGLDRTQRPAGATLADPDHPCDYVLITSTPFLLAFEPLISWRRSQGLQVGVFDIADILESYQGLRPDGGNDDATRLRAFLQDAYTAWQGTAHPLRYVLLGGDTEIIPTRSLFVRAGIFESTADNPVLCDMYYEGLDGDWDRDGDGLYGEGDRAAGGSGALGEEADLLTEISVGRVPVNWLTSDPPDAQARQWVAKLLAYEADPDADYLARAAWLGERLDDKTYGGWSKEEILQRVPSLNVTRLYDAIQPWTTADLAELLNAGVHMVNHLGHANSASVLRMNRQDVEALTNTEPFIVHSQGCLAAAIGTASGESIAEHFVTSEHGAVAFIGNTSYGWYAPGSTAGASQLYDLAFFDALYTERITRLGPALQHAKREFLGLAGAVGPERWVMLELMLLGDPYMSVVVDYAEPVAHLATPGPRYSVAGRVEITGRAEAGSALGPSFASYELSYGAATSPDSWVTIQTGTEPVSGTLGFWDTGTLPDGTYALRLVASSGGGALGIDQTATQVTHARLEAPLSGSFLRAEGQVPVWGTASYGSVFGYQLDYRRTDDSGDWAVIISSTSPVVSGLLGTWDLSEISEPAEYALRLQVIGSDYYGVVTHTVAVDPDYQWGWPQPVANRLTNEGLAIGDLDGDGRLEIVASEGMRVCGGALGTGRCGSYGMQIYVWDAAGILRAGWPIMPGSDNWLTAPTLADLQGNDNPEIIVGSIDGSVYAYSADGVPLEGWPVRADAAILSSPACADIDGDRQSEVVAVTVEGSVYAWHRDGLVVAGWPIALSASCTPPLLVDLDLDLRHEVVVVSSEGWVYAWDGDGKLLTGWPVPTSEACLASPVAGDLDGDGLPEVVVVSYQDAWSWRASGQLMPGWPVMSIGGSNGASPALADLDDDGHLEIIYSLAVGGVRVLRWDGSPDDGWAHSAPRVSLSAPVVGDVDADGRLEIVVIGDEIEPFVHVLRDDGTDLPGWPRPLPARVVPYPWWQRRTAATLADLDADGDLELCVGAEQLVQVYDLHGEPSDIVWPTYGGGTDRRGTLFAPYPYRYYVPFVVGD